MKHRGIVISLFCWLAFAWIGRVQASAAELQPLVGVQYFAGWWPTDRQDSKWLGRDRQDWRGQYPGRVPLLGGYNDQATMDREIAAAADYGVDFFSILWYAGEAEPQRELQESLLNRGLEHFLKSPQAPRLKFMIEYVNHPPFGVTSDAQWQRCVDTWIQAIRHPSYLRVGGKPVLKVHGGSLFLKQAGGNPGQSKTRLDSLRQAARQAGLGELLIGCGVGSGEAIPAGHWAAQVYDFSACYMDVPPQTPREAAYPWDLLARWTAERRQAHLKDAIP